MLTFRASTFFRRPRALLQVLMPFWGYVLLGRFFWRWAFSVFSMAVLSASHFYSFGASFDCFFSAPRALFFFKGTRGVLVYKMPSFFFFQDSLTHLSFCFHKKFYFRSFVSSLQAFAHYLFFFLRLKVRGLGYRIKQMSTSLFRFFMGTCNWLFFHVPARLLVRVRRRRMLLASFEFSLLRLVFSHLLLLRRIIPYKLRGAFFPRQIILMKPGKKSF